MKRSFEATFVKQKRWWVGWTDNVPGALTQGKTLAETKRNLKDAILLMLKPVDMGVAQSRLKIVRDRIRI